LLPPDGHESVNKTLYDQGVNAQFSALLLEWPKSAWR
jgi:hypothetical protein